MKKLRKILARRMKEKPQGGKVRGKKDFKRETSNSLSGKECYFFFLINVLVVLMSILDLNLLTNP